MLLPVKSLTNLQIGVAATVCVWAVAGLAIVLALFDATGGVVFSLTVALAGFCTYLLLVAWRTDQEQEAGMRVSWARTLWERVSAEPMPTRLEEEGDEEYAARVFALAQAAANIASVEPHESEDFRRALDGLDLPVLAFDEQGDAILANRAAASFFAISEEEIRQRAVEELVPQREAFELVQAAIRGIPGKRSVRWAQRILEVVAAPVRGPEEKRDAHFAAVVTLRDVTEMAQAAQLKTDFVASASHEIRTPLASIKAAAETLKDGAAEMPALRDRFLMMILSNTERLEELTRDLMDLSRLETPEVEVEKRDVAISEEIEQLRSMVAPVLAQRKLKLAVDYGGVVKVHTDLKLLRLIMQNLVDNATKFGNEGTDIVVKFSAIAGPDARPGLRLSVTDQGVGIPLAAQARIFERFYQVDMSRSGQQQRRGTGLGLAIVKHAVKSLGGTINVESVWQQGTTMLVELPDTVAGQTEA